MNVDIRNAYGMILYLMLPMSFLFYNWGDLILISFYEGGKFTSSNTFATFSVLKYYSFGLVFISIYHLFVKIFYSVKKYNYVLIISVLAIIVKIVLSALLVKEYKEEGLALSTTLLYIFLMSFASIFLLTKLKVIRFSSLIQKLILILLNLLIAYLISQFIIEFVQLSYLGNKLISLMIFIFTFYFTSYILNDSEINLIKSTIMRFF
jgi:peptidoglycan biosynthesis protein MviN/MurJ (putative lipid II flippase)